MDADRLMILSLFVGFSLHFPSSNGLKFDVGGRDKWVIHQPHSEFLVDDTLYFQKEDCVLQVTRQNYESCNTSNPLRKSENGSSEFKLDRPGVFYFISGVQAQCEVGQKLKLMVTHHHHHHHRAAGGDSPAPSLSGNAPSDNSVDHVIAAVLLLIYWALVFGCIWMDEEPN